MNTERLLKLAEKLDTVPVNKFDMGHWFGGWGSRLASSDPYTCGTSACALGWATVIPEFRDAGLRIIRESDGNTIGILGADGRVEKTGGWAGREFFDLNAMVADELFYGYQCSPAEKARQIRNIVAFELRQRELEAKEAEGRAQARAEERAREIIKEAEEKAPQAAPIEA